MRSRRVGGLTVIVGMALVCVPLYRSSLLNSGIAPVIDPIAAVGFYGGYPVAVGSVAVALASAVLWGDRIDQSATTVVLAAGIVGAVFGVVAISAMSPVPVVWAIQLGLAGAAPGFAAVRGAGTERKEYRLSTGLIVSSLSPFAVGQFLRGAAYSGLGGFASYLIVIAVAVYTAVLSYPFYRIGQLVR